MNPSIPKTSGKFYSGAIEKFFGADLSYTKGTLSREAIREAIHILADQNDRLKFLEDKAGIAPLDAPVKLATVDHLTPVKNAVMDISTLSEALREIPTQYILKTTADVSKILRSRLIRGLKTCPENQRRAMAMLISRLDDVGARADKLSSPKKAPKKTAKIKAK